GLFRPSRLIVSGDGAHLYVGGQSSLAVFGRNAGTGALSFLEAHDSVLLTPIPAKSVLIRNALPDDPERNMLKWTVRVVDPSLGSPPDARCGGQAPGTATMRLRVRSGTSGHDSGWIPLPCKNWVRKTTYYLYQDGELDDGPCLKVLMGHREDFETTRMKATCVGRGATTDLPYDLVPGTDEGRVYVHLRDRYQEYCTPLDPVGPGANGS